MSLLAIMLKITTSSSHALFPTLAMNQPPTTTQDDLNSILDGGSLRSAAPPLMQWTTSGLGSINQIGTEQQAHTPAEFNQHLPFQISQMHF